MKNKVFKKLAAAGVASMMAVTGMVMSVSADYSNVEKSGAHCSGRRVGNGALGSTSMVDGSYTTVGVGVVVYYIDASGFPGNTGTGNGGPRSTSAGISCPAGSSYAGAHITHSKSGTIIYQRDI